jgi:uncharacterized protein YndB with AHSA1/START domain
MAKYQFLTIWLLEAPIEKVWDAIANLPAMPSWWNALKHAALLEASGPDLTGSVWQLTWVTPLGYSLAFKSTITQVKPPHLLELQAVGEVEGTGRWELQSTDEGTLVRYDWTVTTTKAWMNLLAIFLRPLLEWNHNAIMRQGGISLASYLGGKLIRQESH